jgi:hypothetical protein
LAIILAVEEGEAYSSANISSENMSTARDSFFATGASLTIITIQRLVRLAYIYNATGGLVWSRAGLV